MLRHSVALTAVFWLATGIASAAPATCYNDDSHNLINQDEVPPPGLGLPHTPEPSDCQLGPEAWIDLKGALWVSGEKVYDGYFDPAIEARVTPGGVVAFRTEDGHLYRASAGQVERWYEAGPPAREFKLSRTGALIAITADGELIVKGRRVSTSLQAARLFASASGRLVALTTDGRVLDEDGFLYARATDVDAAVAVKVAADGTVVWLKASGEIESTRGQIYTQSTDPAVSFKLSPSGQVAYLTLHGKLWRDQTQAATGVAPIVSFKIGFKGEVTAIDRDGKVWMIR